MQIINDLGGIPRVPFLGIRRLLTQRIPEVKLRDGEALTDVGAFFVVEKGDDTIAIETTTGCSPLTDPIGDTSYGDPDFAPSFEWLEYHAEAHCFEMVFIMTDDYFTVLLIPDDPDIDQDLLAFCKEYS